MPSTDGMGPKTAAAHDEGKQKLDETNADNFRLKLAETILFSKFEAQEESGDIWLR